MFCQLVFKMFFIIISLIASSNIEAFSVFLEKIDYEPHHTTNRVLNYQGKGVPLFCCILRIFVLQLCQMHFHFKNECLIICLRFEIPSTVLYLSLKILRKKF